MINIVLCLDAYEPICFKFGIMVDMTKLYTLFAVRINLMFTQGRRGMGKLKLVK